MRLTLTSIAYGDLEVGDVFKLKHQRGFFLKLKNSYLNLETFEEKGVFNSTLKLELIKATNATLNITF